MDNRVYTSRRMSIVDALAKEIKKIDGTGEFLSDIEGRAYPKLRFIDEVDEFPSIFITPGQELREYQGGGYKDRYLSVTIRVYINEENAMEGMDKLLEDIETVIEDCSRLSYYDKLGNPQHTHQITIISLDSDEGVLEPFGVGTVSLLVHY